MSKPVAVWKVAIYIHVMKTSKDQDAGKGAVEQDAPGQPTNTSMQGQLPHRTKDSLIKDNDSDFPEPGNNEEHSGEPKQKK
jgi:hypothetical protein